MYFHYLVDGAKKPSDSWRKGDNSLTAFKKRIDTSPKPKWWGDHDSSVDSVDILLEQKINERSKMFTDIKEQPKEMVLPLYENKENKSNQTKEPSSIKKYKQTYFHKIAKQKKAGKKVVKPTKVPKYLRNVVSYIKSDVIKDRQKNSQM